MPENASPLRHVVTLVVVVHDGARLIPGLVNAVREQTHPVARAVGVDTSSQDRSGAALTELLGPDAVFGMEADTGYGAAVARALQHPAARRPAPGSGSPPDQAVEWIWLLHDDCEPAPDALEQMLRAASRNRSTAVLGPKLKDLADRRVLREAGVSVDRAGRRFTGIEPGEIDQGQHDGNHPVLAVSSAGMLIRRDVWDQVGGFDPNLPLMRDDIDFCWRVHAAGYDVRVITDAVVYHRDLSARLIRKAPAAGGHPRLADRRGTLYVFAANVPLRPMLTLVAGCVAGSLLRAAYFLLTKQQRKAWDHLGAVAWLLRHPVLLWRARRRRAASRKHAWSLLRGQIPRGRSLGRLAESASGLLAGGQAYDGGGLHHALVDEVGDDMPLPAADSVVRRVLTSPGVLLCAGLTLIALVAERSLAGSVLTGSGTLSGGALVPAWGGASDLWREYLAGYHDAGLGSAASTPPYVGVMAVLATLLAGKPWLAVDVVLFASVPAAGLTAFIATRRVTSVLAARIWLAATYALLPVAMGAVAAGRIGTAVAFVLLPLIGIAAGRMLTAPPRRARRAAWAAGLLVAVAAAFVPLVWPIAILAAVGLVAAWCLARPGDRDQRRDRRGGAGRRPRAVDFPPGHQPVRVLPRGRDRAARAGRGGPAAGVGAAAGPGRPGTAARLGHRWPPPVRVRGAAGPQAVAAGVRRLGHRARRAGRGAGREPGTDEAARRDRGQRLAGPRDRRCRRWPAAGRRATDRGGRSRARPRRRWPHRPRRR